MDKEFENKIMLMAREIYDKVLKFVEENKENDEEIYSEAFLKLKDGRYISVRFNDDFNFVNLENGHFNFVFENGKLVEKYFEDSLLMGNHPGLMDFSVSVTFINYKNYDKFSFQAGDDRWAIKKDLNYFEKRDVKKYITSIYEQIDTLVYDKEKTHSSSNWNAKKREQYSLEQAEEMRKYVAEQSNNVGRKI